MAKVLVGCKLPNGLTLELIDPAPQANGIIPAPTGKRVILKGANSVPSMVVTGRPNPNPATGAFATTPVEAEFAAEWFKRNAEHPSVKQGLVFIAKDEAQVAAESKDRARNRTGLEPLNVTGTGKDRDPRLSKEVSPDLDQLKKLTGRAA